MPLTNSKWITEAAWDVKGISCLFWGFHAFTGNLALFSWFVPHKVLSVFRWARLWISRWDQVRRRRKTAAKAKAKRIGSEPRNSAQVRFAPGRCQDTKRAAR